MKYGLLVFVDTDNIGDDIQSYAQRRFLPSVDYIVDRENLDSFGEAEQLREPVSVIMNAFYMHQKFNWPPAPCLNPLCISMHFAACDMFGIGTRYLDGIGGAYLRHYGPVGARDESTLALLREKGVDAYLSGCMTLTLELPGEACPTDEVILSDVSGENAAAWKARYPDANWVEVTHEVDPRRHRLLSIEERLAKAEAVLRRYRNARCVITERLHCALPCLALGTPVLLIYRDDYLDRMSSFLPLLHAASFADVAEGRVSFDVTDPPANSDAYLAIRRDLEARCRAFIRQAESGAVPPPPAFDRMEVLAWQKSLLRHAWVPVWELTDRMARWTRELQTGKDWLNGQYHSQGARIRELEEQLARRDEQLAQKNEEIAQKNEELAQKDEEIAQKNEELAQKDEEIAQLEKHPFFRRKR